MEENWITVPEAAERLATSEEMVRRYIRQNRLFAKRSGRGVHSPWLVDANQVAMDAEHGGTKGLADASGFITSYGGTPESDAAFVDAVRDKYGDGTAAAVSAVIDRHALIAEVAAAVDEHRDELGLAFDSLDDEAAIEREAQEIAARVLRAERIRARVREIVEDDEQ